MTKHKTGRSAGNQYRYGHWVCDHQVDEENYFGFIYLIVNTVNQRKYIGKKQYYQYRKGKKLKKMAWKSYQGSSKELHKDIKKYGKNLFVFQILFQCSSRGGLAYEEANLQHRTEVLTSKLPSGEKEYYNKSIAGIRFSVREELSDEHKRRISEGLKKASRINPTWLLKDSSSIEGRKRRRNTMKRLHREGRLKYEREFKKVRLYFKDGSIEEPDHWPTYVSENGYAYHGIWNMVKGNQKTMRKNKKSSSRDIVKVEWIQEEAKDD